MSDLIWQIPLAVFSAIILLRLLLAPYWMYKVIEKERDNARTQVVTLQNAKPTISVEPIKMGDTYYLKVTNNGEQAKFSAQITLSSNDPSVLRLSTKSYYQACWDSSTNHEAIVPKGHSASIKLAQLYSSSTPGPISLAWHLFYCAHNNREDYIHSSSHFVGAKILHPDGSEEPMRPCCEYKLHINISANPSLREGQFESDYLISYQRGLEQLSSHKKGSQTE